MCSLVFFLAAPVMLPRSGNQPFGKGQEGRLIKAACAGCPQRGGHRASAGTSAVRMSSHSSGCLDPE